MVKKILLGFISVMILCHAAVFAAGDLYSTDVRQIYNFKDLMRVYVDIEDANSNPIDVPSTSNVSGYIDSNQLTPKKTVRFSDSGEGVADIFLVDTSGSISNSQMNKVKTAIKTWVLNMKENDRIAIVTFGNSTEVKIDYSNDMTAINQAVDSITNNDKQTQFYGGIMEALKITDRNDTSLPKRKNIILISDGVNDYNGGISENDVYSELKSRLIPVYCMWMSERGAGKKGMSTMNSVADYSGGTMYDMAGKDIGTVYSWIKNSILNSCVIDFTYDGVTPDNNEHVLNIRVSDKDKIAENNVHFVMKKNDEESGTYSINTTKNTDQSVGNANEKKSAGEESNDGNENPNKKLIIILSVIGGVLLVLIAVTVIVLVRRRNDETDDGYNVSYSSENINSFDKSMPMQQTVNQKTVGIDGVNSSMNSLVMTSMKTGQSHTIDINDFVTIGRNQSNSVILGDATVSGCHARITVSNGSMVIEDLGSKNGTLVNGCIVNGATTLNSGDIVSFGRDEYRIQF